MTAILSRPQCVKCQEILWEIVGHFEWRHLVDVRNPWEKVWWKYVKIVVGNAPADVLALLSVRPSTGIVMSIFGSIYRAGSWMVKVQQYDIFLWSPWYHHTKVWVFRCQLQEYEIIILQNTWKCLEKVRSLYKMIYGVRICGPSYGCIAFTEYYVFADNHMLFRSSSQQSNT